MCVHVCVYTIDIKKDVINTYIYICKDFPKERYCTPYLSLVPLKM